MNSEWFYLIKLLIKRVLKMADTDQEQQATSTDPTEATATDATATDATATAATATDGKTSVSDFEKALWFIEIGVENLGKEAKAELVALAKKYL